jgi:hypothetical protein
MTEGDIELEAWFVSTVDKSNYPTCVPNVRSLQIYKDQPFRITNSAEIFFWNNLCKCNPNGPFRKLSDDEIIKNKPTSNASVDAYIKKHADAATAIKQLQQQMEELKTQVIQSNAEKSKMEEKYKELQSVASASSVESDKIESIIKENKELRSQVKQLNKALQKTNGEVK